MSSVGACVCVWVGGGVLVWVGGACVGIGDLHFNLIHYMLKYLPLQGIHDSLNMSKIPQLTCDKHFCVC